MGEMYLRVRGRDGKVSDRAIDRFPFTIGRGAENDLVLTDPSVSRDHAFLRFSSAGLAVVDNRSRNGTFVNDERVHDYQKVRTGDRLQLGSVRLEFVTASDEEVPAAAADDSDAHIEYVPAREDWDPVRAFEEGLAPEPGGETALPARAQSLHWLYKLFVDAPLEEVYENILDLIEEVVAFDRCLLIRFHDAECKEIEIAARRVKSGRSAEVHISQEILTRVAQSGESVIVSVGDEASMPSESFLRSGANTAICVPLMARGKVPGVIYLDRYFSSAGMAQKDIDLIGPLAGFVALKLENVRLLQDHIQNQVLYRDLELAKTIQENLLPHEPVRIPGYSVEGFSSSCYQVGGDYFDLLRPDARRLTFVLGDVSGKGLSSALYMAGIRSALHAHLEDGLPIAQLMARLEKHAQRTFRPDYFLTLVVGELDLETGRLLYSNAGHMPPLVVSARGSIRDLEVTDPALNITDCDEFHCRQLELQPGELLFLYTDGLMEAARPDGTQFGVERLKGLLLDYREDNLTDVRRRLISSIEDFTGEDAPNDDRTLILIRRESAVPSEDSGLLTQEMTIHL